ncbi:hypothetical protein COCC4DRAFT_144783 [Bipolaris maydis ATCC 48331]|uniref:Ig-like domain-containing protein n=2 Tax=Cochliobolus heterostrophus TaxID=5016 RepID=M2U066_COCH5|nr:uncharacterized protein COCC4DRAFT_144783 [Bipolaris maydis ATCC 48331]EMD91924.1 hypothetical protein COCHEDRAFT_1099430 [Bipolaris maydis C5]KAH7553161.1 hypothetical protein BM1_08134 [Bipolaris maydis]ENI02592.1 hypothetical protein COCC4DRAFT_144783 [Bipolaris maydis ATCC 48331]KAJ5021462.1 hypothetical protein J3E73DRAFT_375468 [Bipolaris maydis]KAJ5061263.1 hypothetical protein J3E74DRAFT_406127 [Bipolaris maydis]
MKPSNAILFFLPLVATASPLSSPNPDAEAVAELLPRADATCYLHSEALPSQGCDTTPFSGSRKRTVTGGDRFGVRCTARGKPWGSQGYTKWDWVPGWGCWIWAGWTQIGCENGLPYYDDYRSCL